MLTLVSPFRVTYFKVRSPGEAARFNEEYYQKKRDMNYAMSLEFEQIQVSDLDRYRKKTS